MNSRSHLLIFLVGISASASASAFADCADVCLKENMAVREKYSACAKELPGDRDACNSEANSLIAAAQTCMRICNTKGVAEVNKKKEQGKPIKPQP